MNHLPHPSIMTCEKCQKELSIGDFPFCPHDRATPMIHGDECDVWIRHGICNEDGSPKRYTSKAEMKRAAFEAGLTQGGDTPKINQRILEKEQKEAELKKAEPLSDRIKFKPYNRPRSR